jgi:hypothetical protein
MPVSGRIVRAQHGLTTQMARFELSFSRITERARRTARGSLPPAGVDPLATPVGPDGRSRRAIRQRLRRTRSLRRARVAELGALVADMRGRGRWNERLVDERAVEIDRDGAELTALELALRGERTIADAPVVECAACGRIGGVDDRYCAGCGRELARSRGDAGESNAGGAVPSTPDLTTIRS